MLSNSGHRATTGNLLGMGANSTSFKPGYDARRNRKPTKLLTEYRQEVARLTSSLAAEAVDVMVRAMRGEKITKVMLAASQDIINRSCGTAPTQVTISLVGNPVDEVDVSKLSSTELRAIIAKSPEGMAAIVAIDEGIVSSIEELDELEKRLSPSTVDKDDVIEGEVVEVEPPVYSDLDAKASLKQSGVE